MKTGHHLPCLNCHAWVSVAYSVAYTTPILCTKCQPKDTPLKTAISAVWRAIYGRLPTRARIGFVMAWVALYVVALASMAAAMVLR